MMRSMGMMKKMMMSPKRIYLHLCLCLWQCILLAVISREMLFVRAEIETEHHAVIVSCVGDSITFGLNKRYSLVDTYPAYLQTLFSANNATIHWVVKNFGLSGATATSSPLSSLPYQTSEQYAQAMSSQPDVVVMMLGTNDFGHRISMEDFTAGYRSIFLSLAQLPTRPRMYIALPPWVPERRRAIQFKRLDEYLAATRDLIYAQNVSNIQNPAEVGIIDVHSLFVNHPELFYDGLHPTPTGYKMIADLVYKSLLPSVDSINTKSRAPKGSAGTEASGSIIIHSSPTTTTTTAAAAAANSSARYIRVACVGDSITDGPPHAKVGTSEDSYPVQLRRILSSSSSKLTFMVQNFGRKGAEASSASELAYQNTPHYSAAMASAPNIVVIMLGTNDMIRHRPIDAFQYSYRGLIQSFTYLPTKPRIILMLPPFIGDVTQLQARLQITPATGVPSEEQDKFHRIIQAITHSFKQNFILIDLYQEFKKNASSLLLPDNLHPSPDGYHFIAKTLSDAILKLSGQS